MEGIADVTIIVDGHRVELDLDITRLPWKCYSGWCQPGWKFGGNDTHNIGLRPGGITGIRKAIQGYLPIVPCDCRDCLGDLARIAEAEANHEGMNIWTGRGVRKGYKAVRCLDSNTKGRFCMRCGMAGVLGKHWMVPEHYVEQPADYHAGLREKS